MAERFEQAKAKDYHPALKSNLRQVLAGALKPSKRARSQVTGAAREQATQGRLARRPGRLGRGLAPLHPTVAAEVRATNVQPQRLGPGAVAVQRVVVLWSERA